MKAITLFIANDLADAVPPFERRSVSITRSTPNSSPHGSVHSTEPSITPVQRRLIPVILRYSDLDELTGAERFRTINPVGDCRLPQVPDVACAIG